MATRSPSSKSPSTAVTPTISRLTAWPPLSFSAARAFTVTVPLAKLVLWAIHFFIAPAGCGLGRNSVCGVPCVLSLRSMRIFCLLPLAMTTLMPSSATRRAMLHLLVMPPLPIELFSALMYSSRLLPGATVLITSVSGSLGLPLYMPSTLLRIISSPASIIEAISPESSSLSVNISSVTLTVSFSLTTGITPFSIITSMHALWLRYSRRVAKLSFMVSTCPIRMPCSLKRS